MSKVYNDFELMRTINDDDDVAIASGESDNEEEKESKGKSEFSENFAFVNEGDDDSSAWDIKNIVTHIKKKNQVSTFPSLNEKITKKRDQRKELSKEKGVDNVDIARDFESPEEDDSSDNEGDSMEEEHIEKNLKKEKFFEKPPPQDSSKTFKDMNLSRPLMKAISQLGFEHPTPIQSSTIPVALLGKDICACAATGTGKTAAFMLPILERLIYRHKQIAATRVLVLVPTRELAIQVFSVGKELSQFTDIELCLAAGGLDNAGQEAALRRNPEVVVATPGRLIDHLHNTPSFDLQKIEILILDEADRMLDEHFRDQMDELIRLCPKGRQTMLFSATMTDEVEELAALSLNKPVRLFINRNTDVANNLTQEFVRIRSTRENDREAIITALCCRQFKEHCLVFMPTKWQVHRLRIILGLLGSSVDEMHGNLTQLQRLEALDRFKKYQVGILIATDLAARGLDIQGVKTVINYNIPSTIKQYVHRVGRTARAGHVGRSITMVVEKERKLLKAIVKTSKTAVKSRLIPADVINKYKKKIQKLQADIKDILKLEEEEKLLRQTEMEMNKAKNLIVHREEIMARPPRTWVKKNKNNDSVSKNVEDKKKEKMKKSQDKGATDSALKQSIDYDARVQKRARKRKRLRAVEEDDSKPMQKHSLQAKNNKRKKVKTFEKELTDTSKKSLREFRKGSHGNQNKKSIGGKFKSKKRYKRR